MEHGGVDEEIFTYTDYSELLQYIKSCGYKDAPIAHGKIARKEAVEKRQWEPAVKKGKPSENRVQGGQDCSSSDFSDSLGGGGLIALRRNYI